jgi:hypothetical protein
MTTQIIKAPNPLPVRRINGVVYRSIFLAGSIEQGTAIDWQKDLTEEVTGYMHYVFNPRRDKWDASLEQKSSNPTFNEQVSWELTALDMAEYIFMYFDPNTKSPISLLELGLYASSKKLIVCCPEGFWRRGNVEIVCERYDIPLYLFLDDAKRHLRKCVIGVS